jgi:hypothetical protein
VASGAVLSYLKPYKSLIEEPGHLFATFLSMVKDGCGMPRAGQPFTSSLLLKSASMIKAPYGV